MRQKLKQIFAYRMLKRLISQICILFLEYLRSIGSLMLCSTVTWGESSIHFYYYSFIQSQREFQSTICMPWLIPKFSLNCLLHKEPTRCLTM